MARTSNKSREQRIDKSRALLTEVKAAHSSPRVKMSGPVPEIEHIPESLTWKVLRVRVDPNMGTLLQRMAAQNIAGYGSESDVIRDAIYDFIKTRVVPYIKDSRVLRSEWYRSEEAIRDARKTAGMFNIEPFLRDFKSAIQLSLQVGEKEEAVSTYCDATRAIDVRFASYPKARKVARATLRKAYPYIAAEVGDTEDGEEYDAGVAEE